MRHVKPKVRLVARPLVNWAGVVDYLEEVGGGAWFDRLMPDGFVVGAGSVNDGEALVEFGGRLCYRSWEPGLNPNVRKVREDSAEYLGNVLRSGHGSVVEHANYSFLFQDVSRVFTHELVRHRAGAAYSQESMRFVRLTNIPFWFPSWAFEDNDLMDRCLEVLEILERHQVWMSERFRLDDEGVPFAEKKHKTSFMRRFAPDGVATAVLATFNVRAIRHIVYMRTALGAEEEIRLVMDQLAEIMLGEVPNLMADYNVNADREWIPEFLKV